MATTNLNLYSRNSAVAAAGTEIIAPAAMSGDLTDAGTTLRIKAGGNAADTAAGAGCREITITGLDSTGLVISAALATAGASASAATTASFFRINSIDITAMGTALSTMSTTDMVIELGTGGGDIATMNRSRWGGFKYTVPLGHKAVIKKIKMSSNKAAFDMIVTRYKNSINGGAAPFGQAEVVRNYYTTGDSIVVDAEMILDPLEMFWIKAINFNAAEAIMTVEIEGTVFET